MDREMLEKAQHPAQQGLGPTTNGLRGGGSNAVLPTTSAAPIEKNSNS